MKIINSILGDVNEIFRLYRLATDFQKSKFLGNIWPEFDRLMVTTEILEKRQFKIVVDEQVACAWAITFNDAEIWGEKDKEPSIYIHRIATNPNFRGRNFVAVIVNWALSYARENNKAYVRLDTCGYNKGLIKHYTRNGFQFLGTKPLGMENNLPTHYHNTDVCLFQIATIG